MTLHPDDITFAARTMIAVDPPTDLEARIKQRLDREAPRTQPRWRPAYWIGAAGLSAAALLVILVVLGPTRSTVQGSPGEPVVQGPTGSTVHGSGLRSTPGPRANPGPWTRSNLGPQVPRPSTRPSETELAWMSRRIPSLDVIDPLAMDRLTLVSIQPAAISITPLTITPLVTSPVVGDPDSGRQH